MLNNLRDDDLFNIVAYDDRVESFRPELQRYGSRIRDEAERFVDNIREGGSTNIDEALKTALGMIHDRSRPSYVLFLTDGLPTAGEVNELRIAENCRRANERRARVFCFGVGYDVNARLLDRLSGGNCGTSEYVKPDEDIETHVGRFYSKMTSPVLADIRLELAGIDVNRTYPRDLPDLFEGGQLDRGRPLPAVGTDHGPDLRQGRRRAATASSSPPSWRAPYRGSSHDFVERLWAVRRVGDHHRPDRPERPEQGADRRAGRPQPEIRPPDARTRRSWPMRTSPCTPTSTTRGGRTSRSRLSVRRVAWSGLPSATSSRRT